MRRWWLIGLPLLLAVVLAHPARALPDRLAYAGQCAAEMGPIAPFDCLTGQLLDITVEGVAQTQLVDNCDNPVQLGLGGGSQCVPFARLLALPTPRPDVTTITICRKYFASTGPDDPRFDDIAMIQHDRATGRTCFFQSRLEADLDGRTVPSPGDPSPRGDAYWLPPSEVGRIGCSNCHSADPFIWSPYIAQRADLGRWDPLGKYDSNVANLFGAPTRLFQPTGNACVGCHRFGRGPESFGCSIFPHRYAGTMPHVTHPDRFWMPPGFGTDAGAWHASFDAAMAQVDRCCADPALPECRSTPAVGDPPPPPPPPHDLSYVYDLLLADRPVDLSYVYRLLLDR